MGSNDIFWVDNQLCQLLYVPDIQNSNVKQLVYLCSQKNVDRYVNVKVGYLGTKAFHI